MALHRMVQGRVPAFAKATAGESPSPKPVFAALRNSALIREMHTYGQQVKVNNKKEKTAQHKGLGKKLIKKAEQIAQQEFDMNKIAIIAGVGVRNYFRKRGYELEGTYMVKENKNQKHIKSSLEPG